MTREEAIKGLTSLVEVRRKYVGMQTMKDEIECLEMAIKALEQEPCKDAISRQAVIIALGEWIVSGEYQYTNATDYLVKRIKALPPVKPQEPKTGHWIDDGQYADGHSEHACRCSKCGYTYIGYTDKYKECPHCRARMDELTGKE